MDGGKTNVFDGHKREGIGEECKVRGDMLDLVSNCVSHLWP